MLSFYSTLSEDGKFRGVWENRFDSLELFSSPLKNTDCKLFLEVGLALRPYPKERNHMGNLVLLERTHLRADLSKMVGTSHIWL